MTWNAHQECRADRRQAGGGGRRDYEGTDAALVLVNTGMAASRDLMLGSLEAGDHGCPLEGLYGPDSSSCSGKRGWKVSGRRIIAFRLVSAPETLRAGALQTPELVWPS